MHVRVPLQTALPAARACLACPVVAHACELGHPPAQHHTLPPPDHTPTPRCPRPEAAKDVVLAEKPVIAGDGGGTLDPGLLDTLLRELGMLSSVYHRPAASFVSRARLEVARADDLAGARAAAVASDEYGGGERCRRDASLLTATPRKC